MPLDERKDLGLSYDGALHGIQSAVAYEMGIGMHHSTEPKHLRVGVNSAMCEHAALVRLLLEKGIISEAEYKDSIRLELNNEVSTYQSLHNKTFR